MVEIVVWLKADYSQSETIKVPANSTRDEILTILNDRFGIWYYFDYGGL